MYCGFVSFDSGGDNLIFCESFVNVVQPPRFNFDLIMVLLLDHSFTSEDPNEVS